MVGNEIGKWLWVYPVIQQIIIRCLQCTRHTRLGAGVTWWLSKGTHIILAFMWLYHNIMPWINKNCKCDKQIKVRFAGWKHIGWEAGMETGPLEGSRKASLNRNIKAKTTRIMFYYEKRWEDTNILDARKGTFKGARCEDENWELDLER